MPRWALPLLLLSATLLGCGSDPDRNVRMAALGDSVTAGFEAADDSCGFTSEEECESRRLSYPAVYAARHGIDEDEWINRAVSGSSPGDWLDGDERDRLDEVVASDPELTFLTLGANPLVGAEDEVVIQRLKMVYRRLLGVPGNRVVVVAYYDNGPLRRINTLVARAVDGAQDEPGGERLRMVVSPPPAEGDCGDPDVSIRAGDSCLHPSAVGHQKIAAAIR